MRVAARRGLAATALACGALIAPAAEVVDRTASAKFMPIRDDALMLRFLQGMSLLFEPSLVKTSATLEEAVRAQCGFLDRKSFLVNTARVLSDAAVATATGERTLTLPPCPYWVFDTRLSVPPGASKEQLDAKLRQLLGYPYLNKTKAAIDKINVDRDVVELASSGAPINVPYLTRPVAYVVRQELDLSPQEAVRELERNNPAAVIPDAATGESINAGGTARFGLIAPADAKDTDCAPGTFAPVRDAAALADIVARNSVPGASPKAKILVIDTGVDEETMKDFLTNTVSDIGYEFNTYGIEASRHRGPPAPLDDYPLHAHGTSVAALVLGGLSDVQVGAFVRQRIELEAVQVVTRIATPQHNVDFAITGADLATGFTYAQGSVRRNIPAVINLSVEGTAGTYPEVRAALINTSSVVIAAAGNQGLRELKATSTPFPISYKDFAKGRMIVVGAYDPADPLRAPAKFSNIGATWVDILAAGCRVDTVEAGTARVQRSGTSFAAPQVSFAAALLTSMGLAPLAIKARLIAASEFDESLATSAFSSGRFDLLRTLRLDQAVIRIIKSPPAGVPQGSAPTDTALYGDFTLVSDGGHPCADITAPQAALAPLFVALPRDRLVKIVNLGAGTSAATLRFYHFAQEDQRDVVFKECKASDATFTFDASSPPVRWRDLVEFVPRSSN